jgi:anaerobic ribonucleoside-triphosphate reductase
VNPIEIIEKFGIPVAVAMAFGFFIWKQNQYIQNDLTKDIHQKFNRLEGIIVKLIDQQKKMQIEQRGIVKSYQTLIEIITRLFKWDKNA